MSFPSKLTRFFPKLFLPSLSKMTFVHEKSIFLAFRRSKLMKFYSHNFQKFLFLPLSIIVLHFVKMWLFTFKIWKIQEKTWQLRMFLSCSWWYGFWLVKIKCKNWRTAKWLVEITVCCCFSNDVIEFLSWNGAQREWSLRS